MQTVWVGVMVRWGKSVGWWCKCTSRCGVLVGIGVRVGSTGAWCVVGLGRCCVVGVVARFSKGHVFVAAGVGCPVMHGGLSLSVGVRRGVGGLAVEPLIHETLPGGPAEGGGGAVLVTSSREVRLPGGRVGWGPFVHVCAQARDHVPGMCLLPQTQKAMATDPPPHSALRRGTTLACLLV